MVSVSLLVVDGGVNWQTRRTGHEIAQGWGMLLFDTSQLEKLLMMLI